MSSRSSSQSRRPTGTRTLAATAASLLFLSSFPAPTQAQGWWGEEAESMPTTQAPTYRPGEPTPAPTRRTAAPTPRPEMTVPMKKPLAGEKYNYGQVMGLSLMFYEAQRSGALPKNNRIPWRGDSAMEDGKDVGLDLTGGWYDAGDHVKFNFPMAWSATTLAWGVHEYWDAWKQAGELEHALDQLKWVADYLVKCHPDKDTFYVQVGDGNGDHNYWGTAETMTMSRPAYAVGRGGGRQAGSAAIGEAAAALAATSLLFKQHGDTTYAAHLVATAKSLFELANTNQGGFSVSEPFYVSSSFTDELAWAASWLYEATGIKDYLDTAEGLYNGGCCGSAWSYSWDAKSPGVQILLYKQTHKPQYKTDSSNFVGGAISKGTTPKGLAYWDKWGSNRYAANAAFIALVAADYGIHTDDGRAWATKQINYMLGDAHGGINKDTGLPFYSFVCGYGDDFPKVRFFVVEFVTSSLFIPESNQSTYSSFYFPPPFFLGPAPSRRFLLVRH